MLERHRKLGAQSFIALIVLAGISVVAYSMAQAESQQPDPRWAILAVLAGVSALFPVSLPRGKGRDRGVLLTISTIFSFASILIFGPAIAALVTTVEACMSTWKSRQLVSTPQKALFNIFQLPLITFVTAKIFYWSWGAAPPLSSTAIKDVSILFAYVGLTGVLYFALNAATISTVIALVTGQSLRRTWHESFFSAALTNFAESCAAVVIFLNFDETALLAVGIALPTVIVIFYAYKTNMNRIHEAREHLEEVNQLYHSTIEALAMAVDAKDQVTHGHIHRVQVMTLELSRYCGIEDEATLEGLRAAALLHDIGKLATPDHILNKPSSLTDTEMETMKAHATVGADILASVPFPYPVSPFVRYHHEKWDGSGYPEGLTGESIPLGARVLSIVDCYDALRSDRPYRTKLSREAALDYIVSESGKSFDPFVVEQLVNHISQLENAVERIELGLHLTDGVSQQGRGETGIPHTLTNTVFHDIASVHREVQAISDLSQSMGRLLNVSETMALLADKIQKLVPHDACSIFLIDANNQNLVPYSTTGLEADKLGRQELCVGDGLTGWVAAHRRALAGVSPTPDFVDNPELAQVFRSGLAVPLTLDDNIVGVITLYAQIKEAFRPNHLRIVETIAGYAATALANAIMYEETKEDAYTDMLTGLPNLRYFKVFVEQELRRAERSNYPVTLIMMDLDRFKEVNDELGHKAGDRVLIEVAHILRNHMRRADTVVRYGGDEFVGILPGVSKFDSLRILRQIQQAVDNHPVSLTGSCTLQVGFSMGSATFPEDATSLDSLLTIADKEMYRDKLVRAENADSPAILLPFSPKEGSRSAIGHSNGL